MWPLLLPLLSYVCKKTQKIVIRGLFNVPKWSICFCLSFLVFIVQQTVEAKCWIGKSYKLIQVEKVMIRLFSCFSSLLWVGIIPLEWGTGRDARKHWDRGQGRGEGESMCWISVQTAPPKPLVLHAQAQLTFMRFVPETVWVYVERHTRRETRENEAERHETVRKKRKVKDI